ncbi:MAG: hypothetical protein RL139_901 [Gemmatimonadota bacterium]|jgi:phage major head subunit gpT-like protein
MHASVISLLKGLRANFVRDFMGTTSLVDVIATVVSSDSNLETYGWIGEVPAIREWLTERVISGMSETSYAVTNKTWESTLGVKRTDIEDDKLGGLPIRIRQMALRAAEHVNETLVNLLINGTSSTLGLGYDANAFFSDTHPARGRQTTTQDNLLAGTGTSVAQIGADLSAAIAAMKNFVDEEGKPFHSSLGGLVIVAPPGIETNMRTVLNAGIISQTTNVQQGQATLVVSPYLSDVNDWYLLHTGGALRPLIFQSRTPVEFESLDQPESNESAFMRDIYYFGTRARYVGAYGFWQDAIKTTNS